jgi:hypothetical protein
MRWRAKQTRSRDVDMKGFKSGGTVVMKLVSAALKIPSDDSHSYIVLFCSFCIDSAFSVCP